MGDYALRVAMITFGSQGDVRPLVALGQGLVRAGHQAVLLADSEFADLAADVGMDLVPLSGGSLRDRNQYSEFQEVFERGLNPNTVHLGIRPPFFAKVFASAAEWAEDHRWHEQRLDFRRGAGSRISSA